MKLDTSSYYPEPLLPPEEGIDGKPETSDPEDSHRQENYNRPEDGRRPEDSRRPEEPNRPEEPHRPEEPRKPEWELPAEINRGLTIFSNILSWLMVPLLMPVYGILLIFGLSILGITSRGAQTVFTLTVFTVNVIVPMLLIFLLKKQGFVDDYGLNGQKERLIPYIITILCMGATAGFMAWKNAPMWTVMFFTGGALAGLINFIVNFRWKISAHSAGVAGIVALLVHLARGPLASPSTFAWLAVWILLAGLLGSARVWLGRHTAAQVLAGYATGFLSVYLLMMIP